MDTRSYRGFFFVPIHDSRQVAVTLGRLATLGASPIRIAGAVVATWQAVDAALAPVIGVRGVAALYGRSLYLVRSAHPWLAALHQGPLTEMDLDLLAAALAQQHGASAAAGAGDQLQSLYQLLDSLIGPTLTGQLLGPAWDNAFDGFAGQDNSQ